MLLGYFTVKFIFNDLRPDKLSLFAMNGRPDKETVLFISKNLHHITREPGILTDKFDDIKNVSIKDGMNGRISVYLEYKKVLATTLRNNIYYPLGSDGIINRPYDGRPNGLVVFVKETKNVDEILAILTKNPAVLKEINFVEEIEERRFNLILKNRTVVMLPENNVDEALKKIPNGVNVKILDLRDTSKIIANNG
jgi:hypothetical protein